MGAPGKLAKKLAKGLVSVTVNQTRQVAVSHKLFSGSILSNARVWAMLKRIDAAEAERSRSAGCPHCSGALHSATYLRKPHGLSPALRSDARRHSLCCATCRRRVLPPSVRFFGRRFRVAPLFLAVSALLLAGGARLEEIGRKWGIPALTLRRWRRWWQETFTGTRPWRWKQGELAVAPDEAPLVVLLASVGGRSESSRLLRGLIWLMPWTGCCTLGDGRAPSAETVSSRAM